MTIVEYNFELIRFPMPPQQHGWFSQFWFMPALDYTFADEYLCKNFLEICNN